MVTNSIGYAGTWKRLPQRAIVAALAVLAIGAAVLVGTRVDFGGSGHQTMADATKIVRFAPSHEADSLNVYLVSSEEQRQQVVSGEEEAAYIASLDGETPTPFMVVVADQGDASPALQAVLDTQVIRTQDGLPFTLVDLR